MFVLIYTSHECVPFFFVFLCKPCVRFYLLLSANAMATHFLIESFLRCWAQRQQKLEPAAPLRDGCVCIPKVCCGKHWWRRYYRSHRVMCWRLCTAMRVPSHACFALVVLPAVDLSSEFVWSTALFCVRSLIAGSCVVVL